MATVTLRVKPELRENLLFMHNIENRIVAKLKFVCHFLPGHNETIMVILVYFGWLVLMLIWVLWERELLIISMSGKMSIVRKGGFPEMTYEKPEIRKDGELKTEAMPILRSQPNDIPPPTYIP